MRLDGGTVRRYHDATALGRDLNPSDLLLDFVVQDPANTPVPFKSYVGVDHVDLTTDLVALDVPAAAVMAGGFMRAAGAVGARELASLLFFAAGVTRTSVDPDGTRRYFRAAPAGGNLHAHEVYVATGDLGDVRAGLYHLRPDLHRLETLRNEDPSCCPRSRCRA